MRKNHSVSGPLRGVWLVLALVLMCLGGCAAQGSAPAPSAAPAAAATPVPGPTPVPEVSVGSHSYAADRTELNLSCRMSLDELTEIIGQFPQLRYAAFYGGGVTLELQEALTGRFPEVTFRWDTSLLGRVIPYHAKDMSFAGQPLTTEDLAEIRRAAALLPWLERVDLSGCGLDDSELHALDEDLGDIDVIWPISVYGVECPSNAAEIDISGARVRDGGAEIEALLPLFSRVEKVIMSDCGLSDEEMDALDKRHEDVRFVWTVHFSVWSLRTDADYFIANKPVEHGLLTSPQAQPLRYCTDLIALDLGHKNLTDLSFLYPLTKLQFLILVGNDINDITPIGALPELKYLEVFWTKIEDISPLINCRKLLDLNICYIYCKSDRAYETLMQMPWLERLWYCGNALTGEQIENLRALMPECEMFLEPHAESTGGGWRDHPRYFEMRDIFEMYYMPGGTNGVDEFGQQIIIPG